MAKINETLRQLRLDRGMTQEEVAEQVGLTRQAVSGYESGRTQPGVDILQRLAEIYETDLTDIIYGRNQGIRLYNGLKITTIVMAAVFLAVQLAGSVLLWVANTFYSIAPGSMTEAGKLIWTTRSKLMDARTALDGFHYGLFPLCCVALLVLTLCLRRPLAAKPKLLCTLYYAAASLVVILPWALSDPFYPAVNYLTTPGLCLLELLFFLLLSLVIDFFRGRRAANEAGAHGACVQPSERAGAPIVKRWWFWAAIAVAVLAAVAAAVIGSGEKEITAPAPVENPAFTLNGEDYPQNPILQDFLDRGWKRDRSTQQTGRYNEEDGVTDLVVTGYRLTYGENHVTANLDVEEVRSGLQPGECRLISLSLYGDDIMSFTLNGKELSRITLEKIEDILGEPNRVDELAYGGRTYIYALPEKNISQLSFTFQNGYDPVGQIMVVFRNAPDK